jgi:hypothetical protein
MGIHLGGVGLGAAGGGGGTWGENLWPLDTALHSWPSAKDEDR